MVCMWHERTRNLPPPFGVAFSIVSHGNDRLPWRERRRWGKYRQRWSQWLSRNYSTNSGTIALNDSWSRPCGRDESNRRIYTLLKSNDIIGPSATAVLWRWLPRFTIFCILMFSEHAHGNDVFFLVVDDGLYRRTIDAKSPMNENIIGRLRNQWK